MFPIVSVSYCKPQARQANIYALERFVIVVLIEFERKVPIFIVEDAVSDGYGRHVKHLRVHLHLHSRGLVRKSQTGTALVRAAPSHARDHDANRKQGK